VAARYYAWGIGLLAIVKEFTSVFYLSRDFARYVRSCSRRPRVVVAGFDPLAAAAKYLGCRVSFMEAHPPPPVFSALPSLDGVLSGRALPDFGALRLRAQDSFCLGMLNEHFHVWEALSIW
jgi:hypothetical protein